ncbi:sensor histidine kinase [Larkinella humicola]|uniref:Sensor histidine kinase n=1 Tax=Larkinella humicola TaxID=2607654 RepID=A0A5N1J8P7_9BACT|nr:sensor histidine kinase [Larkinella humicola]KAA9347855.1 sensor histidine kinase [Larkinella humicola]
MKRTIPPILIHILLSLAFLSLPYLFAPDGFSGLTKLTSNPHERTNFLSYLFMLVFFYANYYYLIPKLYLEGKYILYVTSLAGSFLLLIGAVVLVDRGDLVAVPIPALPHPPRPQGPVPGGPQAKPPFGFELSHALFLYLVGIFVSLYLQIKNRWRQTEQEKLSTELSYLKAQINPHFLFNTLNSIYSLAIEKSDKTADAVVKLSSLMRYVIRDAGSHEVPLAKEVAYISDYIALQQLRLDDTVQIEYAVSGFFNGKQIAPLILISFIENAFKYGVNPEEKSIIHITISLNENTLRLYVFNKKVRLYHNDEASGGIGIDNTKARLKLVYPNQHVLTINDNPTGFAVDLTLNLA